jgi:hypothetical protein
MVLVESRPLVDLVVATRSSTGLAGPVLSVERIVATLKLPALW